MANKRKTSSTQSVSKRKGSSQRRGRSVIAAQREINQDYKNLVDDYGTLAARLWKIPATRYVLGGLAVATIFPMAMRALRKIPKVDHFMDENMNALSEKIEELEDRFMDKFASSTGGKEDSKKDSHAH